MQCCATVRATWRQQQTPKLGMDGGRRQMWIVLFSKVACTPLKDRVSTILPPVVGMEKKKKLLSSYHCSNSDEYNILFYFKTLTLPVVNRGEPPPHLYLEVWIRHCISTHYQKQNGLKLHPLQWHMSTSLYLWSITEQLRCKMDPFEHSLQ